MILNGCLLPSQYAEARDEYADTEGKFVAHGEEVEHPGCIVIHEGESDEEAVAAGRSAQSDHRFDDEYPERLAPW